MPLPSTVSSAVPELLELPRPTRALRHRCANTYPNDYFIRIRGLEREIGERASKRATRRDAYSQPRGRLLATCLTQATVSGLNDRVIVSGKPDYYFSALCPRAVLQISRLLRGERRGSMPWIDGIPLIMLFVRFKFMQNAFTSAACVACGLE